MRFKLEEGERLQCCTYGPLWVTETVRAMTHVINQGMAMYWGTSRWSPMEIMVTALTVIRAVVDFTRCLEKGPGGKTAGGGTTKTSSLEKLPGALEQQ